MTLRVRQVIEHDIESEPAHFLPLTKRKGICHL